MTDCWNADHFQVVDGALSPQSWMQWRHVASVAALSVTKKYPPTQSSSSASVLGTVGSLFGPLLGKLSGIFGLNSFLAGLDEGVSSFGNKNDLVHDIHTSYTNDSPIDQWVYGKITRGGVRVTLQVRSRGGFLLSSGYKEDVSDAGTLVEASMFGCGGNLGNAGTLNIGTTFGIIETRMNSTTIPLAPERLGWYKLAPAATLTARATLRFVTDFWENTTIDGGDVGTESSYESGDTRLDLFAVPVI